MFELIFLLGMYQLSFSQSTNRPLENKADSLRNEGNLKEAVLEYNRLYRQNPDNKTILYNYACALSLFGQNDSCIKYLNEYMTIDTTLRILMDPDFCPLRRDKRWIGIENRVVDQINIKYNHPYKNLEFAKNLWRMRAVDQFGFSEIGIAIKKTGANSSVVRGIWECKFIIGENLQNELDNLIAKYGWPRVKDVGEQAARAAFTIILHSNSQLILKYLPTVKTICEENELPWEQYAVMYDRALWYDKKPQRYGTHTQYNEMMQKEELYPLEDASKVDVWRKEIGLVPLKEYLARFNIKYEPDGNK
jgi:tetratricopeptide (TPR) repeat protein